MEKNKSKTKIIKTILIIFILIIAFVAYQFIKIKKETDDRRAAFEEQRQVMIDSWKEQGLSDDEIQQKLKTQRPIGFNPGEDTSLFHSIYRVIRGGGRPGTGDGSGPGRMIR